MAFVGASAVFLGCQAVATGLVGLLVPWIVIATALRWVPEPGQVANAAAGVLLLAAASAPLERRIRSYWPGGEERASASPSRPPAPPAARSCRHTKRLFAIVSSVAAIFMAGSGLMIVAGSAARSQPMIELDALRTQERGETALAYDTLAPAAEGPYSGRKFELYFLLSGWALDLSDFQPAAQLSIDLMRAASADEHPRSLVAGISQYEVIMQATLPHSLVTEVILAAPSGPWRAAVRLLLRPPRVRDASHWRAEVESIGGRLGPTLMGRFYSAVALVESRLAAGTLLG